MESRFDRARIGVDIDSTLANLVAAMVYRYNQRHPVHTTVVEWDSWGMHEKLNITKDEFYQTMNNAWKDWQSMPLQELGLSTTLKKLQKLGSVTIISNRHIVTHAAVGLWLEYHCLPYDALVLDSSTGMDKWDYPIDILIDDNPKHAEAIPDGRLLLLRDHPWNRHIDNSDRITRVSNVFTAADLLTRRKAAYGG